MLRSSPIEPDLTVWKHQCKGSHKGGRLTHFCFSTSSLRVYGTLGYWNQLECVMMVSDTFPEFDLNFCRTPSHFWTLGNGRGLPLKMANVQVLYVTKNEDPCKTHTSDKLLNPRFF